MVRTPGVGHPLGFVLSPRQFCEQTLAYERGLPVGEDLRKSPLAEAVIVPGRGKPGITKVAMNVWLEAWGMPFPLWPRDFLLEDGRPVMVYVAHGVPPFRLHWVSPNCHDLLGYAPDALIGESARVFRRRGTSWQREQVTHDARCRAQSQPNTTVEAEGDVEFITARGEPLPVRMAFRYGEHRGRGTYFVASAFPVSAHREKPTLESDYFNTQPYLIEPSHIRPAPPNMVVLDDFLTTGSYVRRT